MSERNISIAVRAHTKLIREISDDFKGNKRRQKEDLRRAYGTRVMVLDTETTTDEFQNLKFGQAYIYEGKHYQAHLIAGEPAEKHLFYGDDLTENELGILAEYASRKALSISPRQEFIDNVFWQELVENGTVLVCFNLPFDLSRLAIKVRTFAKGKHKDKFEFTLSESSYKPTILLKPIDSKKAFVELRFPTRQKRQSERIPFRPGRFLDLKTLVFGLTNESHSLESACRLYGTEQGKQAVSEHGQITADYLEYNTGDIIATWELYCKAKEEFDRHPIDLEAGKAYSPASIGKAYYKALGVMPLKQKQTDFPDELLGYAMAAYYGGRAECHFRNKPVKVFHTDVTSMYPSVFTLQRLWDWVIAERLEYVDATEEFRKLISGLCLESLFMQEIWQQIPGLVLVRPDHDLLPVRAKYGEGAGYQIGLNYLSIADEILKEAGTEGMWYTLADIVAAKILSGKTPEILKAYRITPRGKQSGLQSLKLRGEIEVDPASDNFFKKVIEKRKAVKKVVREKGDNNDALQMFLKILANSTSYGVYIELNRDELPENASIEVFGLDHFNPRQNEEFEKAGKFYNPLIAVMITGAARLILAMMERTTKDLGGTFAFCDTDSMSVIDLANDKPELIGQNLVKKFQCLLPFDRPPFGENDSLLEAETYNWGRTDWNKDSDDGNLKRDQYYPLYCFMVSAKRYVLYNLVPDGQSSNKIVIRKKSDHGLGHLTSPIPYGRKDDWINEVWKWLLSREHDLPYKEPEWFYVPAFAQSSISKPSIFDIFNRDESKPYHELIKPANFFLVSYPQSGVLNRTCVDRFYCRLHKKIGLNFCDQKGRCEYSKGCYANLHTIPISSFRKDFSDWNRFAWFDKNTKEPVKLQSSQNRSKYSIQKELQFKAEKDLKETFPKLKGAERLKKLKWLKEWHAKNTMLQSNQTAGFCKVEVVIKNYFDFIGNYATHPELKYDGPDEQICRRDTKGLLQRTHVLVKSIKHIGKEAETIQDAEEEAILPEETGTQQMHYQPTEKKTTAMRFTEKGWKHLLPVLREKAKPRKEWAGNLGITERHLKRILSQGKVPSPDLCERILEQCKAENISRPSSGKPTPARFEESPFLVSRLWDMAKQSVNMAEFESRFPKNTFALYGTKYVYETPEVKAYMAEIREQKHEREKQEKVRAIHDLKITGVDLVSADHPVVTFDVEDIVEFCAAHKVGKNYCQLNVKLKDSRIFSVPRKNNELAFRLGLLPTPFKLFHEYEKRGEIQRKEKNGFAAEYTPFVPYSQNPQISLEAVVGHYGLAIVEMIEKIRRGNIPPKKGSQLHRKTFLDGYAVWKLYLKEIEPRIQKGGA